MVDISQSQTIEITIPVLNEAATLGAQISKVLGFLENLTLSGSKISVVIADNGSNDGTQEIGEKLALENVSVKYIRLDRRGVGLALKTSWGQSTADIVGYMDLDLATDMKHLSEAFLALAEGGGDLVYGSRLNAKSVVVGRSLKRNFVSRVFNLILRVYLRASFSDGMCGFKFLRRNVLPKLTAAGADSDGWFFSTELLVTAQHLGYRVYELPVQWTDDPDSRVNIPRLAWEYLKAMHRLKGILKNASGR